VPLVLDRVLDLASLVCGNSQPSRGWRSRRIGHSVGPM